MFGVLAIAFMILAAGVGAAGFIGFAVTEHNREVTKRVETEQQRKNEYKKLEKEYLDIVTGKAGPETRPRKYFP